MPHDVVVSDTEEFLGDMDEDMEAMQATVYLLQQELKEVREKLRRYELDASCVAMSLVTQNGMATGMMDGTGDGMELGMELEMKDITLQRLDETTRTEYDTSEGLDDERTGSFQTCDELLHRQQPTVNNISNHESQTNNIATAGHSDVVANSESSIKVESRDELSYSDIVASATESKTGINADLQMMTSKGVTKNNKHK